MVDRAPLGHAHPPRAAGRDPGQPPPQAVPDHAGLQGSGGVRTGETGPDAARRQALIIGIGNILWADEGFGVRAVEAFHRSHLLPDDIELMDGGTQGLYLVNYLEGIDDLLVFDAVDYGLEPGELVLVRDAEVPKFTGAKKMSLHQTGFQEVLSAADLLGFYPKRLALIGCQPEDLEDWGGPLTEPVAGQVEPAIATAVRILDEWGYAVRRRETPLPETEALLANDIDRAAYERRAETVVAR